MAIDYLDACGITVGEAICIIFDSLDRRWGLIQDAVTLFMGLLMLTCAQARPIMAGSPSKPGTSSATVLASAASIRWRHLLIGERGRCIHSRRLPTSWSQSHNYHPNAWIWSVPPRHRSNERPTHPPWLCATTILRAYHPSRRTTCSSSIRLSALYANGMKAAETAGDHQHITAYDSRSV